MVNSGDLSKFCLCAWPFKIVPDEEFCRVWADRKELYKTWQEMFAYVINRKVSTIYIVWGYYGAGKTHGLMHFKWQLFDRKGSAYVIYHEFPKSARNFLDLYRTFVKSMDFQKFSEAVKSIIPGLAKNEKDYLAILNKRVTQNWSTLSKIFLMLLDSQNAELAERWIRCEKVSLPELRKVGIGERIEESTDAIRALTGIVRILTVLEESPASYGAVLWMIDECQMLHKVYPRHADEIKGNLTSFFNACPNNLCLTLAFKSDSPLLIRQILPEDMLRRLPLRSTIRVPAFRDTNEAKGFILDLLENFRPKGIRPPDRFFPFAEDAIDETIRFIASRTNEITPRDLMLHFDRILDVSDNEGIIKKDKDRIDAEYVRKTLSQTPF